MDIIVFETALEYVKGGLSVIPIRTDGSKAPALESWKPYQQRCMNREEIKNLFSKKVGIAIVCGAVSKNVEVIDFDAPELFTTWCNMVEYKCVGLLKTLPRVKTPTGGWHIYYRCVEIAGNRKLARSNDGKNVLIETRGEGGYVVAPPSPASCHPHNKPYTLINGSLQDIPEITTEERNILLRLADSFNQYIEKVRNNNSATEPNRPGDEYNQYAIWEEILIPHGWSLVRTHGSISYWRKPYGEDGHHATTGGAGDHFFVFSTAAPPFEPEKPYTKFAVYTLLNHQGDFRAAARQLSAKNDRLPPQYSQPIFTPYSFQDLLTRPPKTWLLNTVFGKGDLGIIYGPPACGKTFMVIDMLIAVSIGRTWANLFSVSRPLNVAYCAGEGHGGLPSRFVTAAKYHGLDSLENLTFYELTPQLYGTGATIKTFINEWKARQQVGAAKALDLLVIDTLHTACAGADENSSQDMGEVLQNCRLAILELGCTVILIHHTNKAGTAERGSLALRASADFMIEVKKKAQNAVIACSKLKDGEPWSNVSFQLCTLPGCESVYIHWENLGDGSATPSEEKSDKTELLAAMQRNPGVRFTCKSLSEVIAKADNHTRNLLSKMVKARACKKALQDPNKSSSKNNPWTYFIEENPI